MSTGSVSAVTTAAASLTSGAGRAAQGQGDAGGRPEGAHRGGRPQGPPPSGGPGRGGRAGGPPSAKDFASNIDTKLQELGVDDETRATVIEQLSAALSELSSGSSSTDLASSLEAAQNARSKVSQGDREQFKQTIDAIFEQNGIDPSQLRKGAFLNAEA